MKKTILFVLFVFYYSSTPAQWINTLSVIPTNPTSLSQIKITANIDFPSGGCNDYTQFLSSSGTTFYGSALHCLGPLSVICNITDTFSLGQLAPGNYNFVFNVNAGGGPSPCSPGIVPGPVDSIQFSVSLPTYLEEMNSFQPKVMYSASSKFIEISNLPSTEKSILELYTLEGKLVKLISSNSGKVLIELGEINAGTYLLKVQNSSLHYTKKIFFF